MYVYMSPFNYLYVCLSFCLFIANCQHIYLFFSLPFYLSGFHLIHLSDLHYRQLLWYPHPHPRSGVPPNPHSGTIHSRSLTFSVVLYCKYFLSSGNTYFLKFLILHVIIIKDPFFLLL